jgi:hypothetical protein
MEVKTLLLFETSGITHPATQITFLGDLNLQHGLCENSAFTLGSYTRSFVQLCAG